MRTSIAAGAALLALAAITQSVAAAGFIGEAAPERPQRFAAGHMATLPPVGFVDFCGRHPDDCKPSGRRNLKLRMTGEGWHLVYQVNSYVNGKVAPASDRDLYGEDERWAYPADKGDCEDYVLLKRRYLERLGFARSALLITVVLDERRDGHAVLTLRTREGDFVLDKRRNDIRRWTDLNYTYLKRQSESDPRQWVSLAGEATAMATRPPRTGVAQQDDP